METLSRKIEQNKHKFKPVLLENKRGSRLEAALDMGVIRQEASQRSVVAP